MSRTVRLADQVIEDFWSKVIKTDTCWLWSGTRTSADYGWFRWDGGMIYAHRFVMELQGHDITDKVVLHECDYPPCVNPDHLRVGTHADNIKDKCSKGRQTRGDSHPMSKITEEETKEILVLLSMGIYQKTIAAKFGVTQSLISKIRTGVTRGHIKVAP